MQLLERARQAGNPLTDERKATFVWSGETAPLLAGDFNGWNVQEPVRLHEAAPGLWSATLTLPADAYVEYAFFASSEPDDRTPDPLNRRRVWNGVSAYNHFFYMPQARPHLAAKRRFGIPKGTVSRITVPALRRGGSGGKRSVYLYAPPETTAPYPLIVCWDGPDYLRRGHLVTIVDNLIADKRIWPVGLVMIENGKTLRMLEYMANEYTLLWLLHAVLPAAAGILNGTDVTRHPGAWGVMGASMGGLMALYTGLRAPGRFGRVLMQSGAFEFAIDGRPHPIFDMVTLGEKLPLKMYQDTGTMEWLLDSNRRMHDALAGRGYDVRYQEFNAGHNYTAWSNMLPRALETLFGREG
jgi:enterochelin esterase-like enzyme